MSECLMKYKVSYLDSSEVTTPEDTHRPFIGQAVQNIVEFRILNKDVPREEFDAVIDNELKTLKKCIYELKDTFYAPESQEFPDNTYFKKFQTCYAGTSKGYIIYVAQNTIIKKIREAYKPVLDKLEELYLPSYSIQPEIKFMKQIIPSQLPVPEGGSEHDDPEELTMTGTLDFHMESVDGIEILDGKMNAVDIDEETGVPKLKEGLIMKDQLLFYAYISDSIPNLDKLGFWDYYKNLVCHVDFAEHDFTNLIYRVKDTHRRYLDAVRTGDFPLTPSHYGCMFCSIKSTCAKPKVDCI